MSELLQMRCVACRGGDPPVTEQEMREFQPQVPDWQVIEVEGVKRLERSYKFKNFIEAVGFTTRLALISQEQDHHPRIVTEWGRVTVHWWTHAIQGLHKNDFIMAARTDALLG